MKLLYIFLFFFFVLGIARSVGAAESREPLCAERQRDTLKNFGRCKSLKKDAVKRDLDDFFDLFDDEYGGGTKFEVRRPRREPFPY